MASGLRILACVAALLLAAAFGFFGYFKSFTARPVHEQHHAWTTALPDLLGRAVRLSELLATALLLIFGAARRCWCRALCHRQSDVWRIGPDRAWRACRAAPEHRTGGATLLIIFAARTQCVQPE
ncbi:MAG: hypothetical protein ACK4GG_05605 [Sphingomonas sp.]